MLPEEVQRRLLSDPAVKCNSPRRIYNPYLKMHMLVPCRKCSTCLDNRSSELSMRVDAECTQHKYSIFFTLTYDNVHLPVMRVNQIDCSDHAVFVSEKYYPNIGDRMTFEAVCHDSDFARLRPRNWNECDYCFGYVDRYDIVCFLKRLRTSIFRKIFNKDKETYNNYGKIRYFISSEYGPHTYRPHYHGIIWTDTKEVADRLLGTPSIRNGQKDYSDSLIYQAWQMCDSSKVDISFVTGSAASYVASYTNSMVDLPKILLEKPLRPFTMASKNPVIGLSSSDEQAVSYCLSLGDCHTDKLTSAYTTGVLPLDVFRKHFGFPKRCYQYDINGFIALFEKYDKGNYVKQVKSNDKFVPVDAYLPGMYFNLQDYYFYKKCKRWLSVPHLYFTQEDSGRLLVSQVKYDKVHFLFQLHQLINSYKRYANELFYFRLSHTSPFDCSWLSEYPNTLCSLPKTVSGYNEFFDLCGLDDVCFSYLYNVVKDKYVLDSEFVKSLLHKRVDSYVKRHALHIKHSTSTKVFNDYLKDIFTV